MLELAHRETVLNHIDDGISWYRRALAANPDIAEARAVLMALTDSTPEDIKAQRVVLRNETKPPRDRVWAGFSLGQALDRADAADEAFAVMRSANDLAHAASVESGLSYDAAAFENLVDSLIECFTPSACRDTAWGDPTDLPVLVVGSPRSGATFVHQILSRHSRIAMAGEHADISEPATNVGTASKLLPRPQWSRSLIEREAAAEVERLHKVHPDALRVVDQPLGNLVPLGHLSVLLPRARIILCRRDPRDWGLATWFSRFTAGNLWSNGLTDIAAHARQLERLIVHWRAALPNPIIEVDYVSLIADPERQARRLVEFLGLEWDPRCTVSTLAEPRFASARHWQVLQLLHQLPADRWRRYERQAAPLLENLHVDSFEGAAE
jgi:hypothetical protein